MNDRRTVKEWSGLDQMRFLFSSFFPSKHNVIHVSEKYDAIVLFWMKTDHTDNRKLLLESKKKRLMFRHLFNCAFNVMAAMLYLFFNILDVWYHNSIVLTTLGKADFLHWFSHLIIGTSIGSEVVLKGQSASYNIRSWVAACKADE